MQLKLKLLIPGAILTLLALTSIQGYLIFNSYELQRKTFLTDARSAIASIYNTPQIDSTFWEYRNDFQANLQTYMKGELTKEALIHSLKSKMAEINPGFNAFFSKRLKEKDLGVNVNLKIIPQEIVLKDSTGFIDSLLLSTANRDSLSIGTQFREEGALLINNSSWRQDLPYINENGESLPRVLEYKTQVYMSIDNWEKAMFNSMLGLFVAVFFLLIFVVTLLFYSIRNLIKQKKLADIKTDFINNITHELKTPLSTLAIATKNLTMQNSNGSKENADKTLAVIERQNIRLHKLIDQVVNNSVGYQDLELSKERIIAHSFLSNIIHDYQLTLEDNIQLNTQLNLEDEVINGDRFFLGTAIINILNNAVKYGGTKIQINAAVEGDYIQLSIQDNGIGIAGKNHHQVFDKFFRVSQQNKHDYKGLGLGLFYCNQVIKAHYGRIEVESQLKKGSTFHLFIPLKKSKS